jgi:hypothetical protein
MAVGAKSTRFQPSKAFRMASMNERRLLKFILLLGVLLLAACAARSGWNDANYGASVGIVNHTDKFIYSVVVNGGGGGNMTAWGAGGADVCCVVIPKRWYPGMQVVVRWDMPEGSKHVVKEKRVDVEKYDEPGNLYIHVFPNDGIRVVVSMFDGWNENHPIPAPAKPTGQTHSSSIPSALIFGD